MESGKRPRHGRIDDFPDLDKIDLVEFYGSNPHGNNFITAGFRPGASYFRSMIERWKFVDRGSVADIGCGYGRWSLFLAEVNDRVIGFERNAADVDLCQKLAVHFGFDNTSFALADVTRNVPAEDASFDVAWCFNTIHFLDRAKILGEINRILKTGGMVHLGAFNGIGRVLEKFFEGYNAGGLKHSTTQFALESLKGGPLSDGGRNYASPAHLPQILERYGFKLVDDPQMQIDFKRISNVPGTLIAQLDDPAALASRLQADDQLAAEFARFPELAYGAFPINVSLCAVKDRDFHRF